MERTSTGYMVTCTKNRWAQLQDGVLLAQLSIHGHITDGLSHEPDWRTIWRAQLPRKKPGRFAHRQPDFPVSTTRSFNPDVVRLRTEDKEPNG